MSFDEEFLRGCCIKAEPLPEPRYESHDDGWRAVNAMWERKRAEFAEAEAKKWKRIAITVSLVNIVGWLPAAYWLLTR